MSSNTVIVEATSAFQSAYKDVVEKGDAASNGAVEIALRALLELVQLVNRHHLEVYSVHYTDWIDQYGVLKGKFSDDAPSRFKQIHVDLDDALGLSRPIAAQSSAQPEESLSPVRRRVGRTALTEAPPRKVLSKSAAKSDRSQSESKVECNTVTCAALVAVVAFAALVGFGWRG